MSNPIPVCDLADALGAQEVEAGVFLPFAIRCLQGSDPQRTEAQISVRIVEQDGNVRTEPLIVRWAPGYIPTLPPAVQSHIVTEWGALGVACVILHVFGDGLRLTSVAQEGDRFDYWVGNDTQEWGLEISGTGAENLQERHDWKVSQLLNNPYNVDGFVIVVRFAFPEAWFTFHRIQERRAG